MATTLIFLVLFSVLIVGHELGHFLAARAAGMRVEEFGIGMPSRLRWVFWKDRRGTEYSLNALFFGGFVRVKNDFDAAPADAEPDSFAGKNWFWRAAFLLGGIFMNFLLAILLLTAAFFHGAQPLPGSAEAEKIMAESPPVFFIDEVAPGSAAATAGLQPGDEIAAVDGARPGDLGAFHAAHAGEKLDYLVVRGEESFSQKITIPDSGKIGVAITARWDAAEVRLPAGEALAAATRETWRLTKLTVLGLGEMARSLLRIEAPAGVSGPVGIFQMTGEVSKHGLSALLVFAGMLSVSLAVLNAMPFPALDGGRFLFLIFEAIALGRRIPQKFEAWVHAVGMVLLLGIIAVVTFQDFARIFGK